IFPGESEGPYRVGGDEFFTDADGQSRVSVVDYAKAMLDEAENAKHINQRIRLLGANNFGTLFTIAMIYKR
ncbi:MAG TPA: hypothetical protein DDW91_10765, partial [Shewanella frigidimarina]|nr:hypothetical protein [Shewanella frigidimarina]